MKKYYFIINFFIKNLKFTEINNFFFKYKIIFFLTINKTLKFLNIKNIKNRIFFSIMYFKKYIKKLILNKFNLLFLIKHINNLPYFYLNKNFINEIVILKIFLIDEIEKINLLIIFIRKILISYLNILINNNFLNINLIKKFLTINKIFENFHNNLYILKKNIKNFSCFNSKIYKILCNFLKLNFKNNIKCDSYNFILTYYIFCINFISFIINLFFLVKKIDNNIHSFIFQNKNKYIKFILSKILSFKKNRFKKDNFLIKKDLLKISFLIKLFLNEFKEIIINLKFNNNKNFFFKKIYLFLIKNFKHEKSLKIIINCYKYLYYNKLTFFNINFKELKKLNISKKNFLSIFKNFYKKNILNKILIKTKYNLNNNIIKFKND